MVRERFGIRGARLHDTVGNARAAYRLADAPRHHDLAALWPRAMPPQVLHLQEEGRPHVPRGW